MAEGRRATEGERLIAVGFAEGFLESFGASSSPVYCRAKTLLALFEHRKLVVGAGTAVAVHACQSTTTLDRWIERATFAATAQEAILDA